MARGRHSVAFLNAYGADNFAAGRNYVVFAGLGRDLARCQLLHGSFFLLTTYFVEIPRNYARVSVYDTYGVFDYIIT